MANNMNEKNALLAKQKLQVALSLKYLAYKSPNGSLPCNFQ